MTDQHFSRAAWARNEVLYERIRTMPFNQALAEGTLSPDRFRQYIVQDAHYLIAFARALAIASAKADDADGIVQFAEAAKIAVVVERSLHADYFDRFGVSAAEFASAELSPACHHYTTFLLATAHAEPYPLVLAALLPCFWVYAEVGKDIHGRAAEPNPYRAWIDAYASEEFEAAVAAVIATTDRSAGQAAPATLEAMHGAFTRAMQLEWMFWDSAWRLERWPV